MKALAPKASSTTRPNLLVICSSVLTTMIVVFSSHIYYEQIQLLKVRATLKHSPYPFFIVFGYTYSLLQANCFYDPHCQNSSLLYFYL
jgi:hypothetical protein